MRMANSAPGAGMPPVTWAARIFRVRFTPTLRRPSRRGPVATPGALLRSVPALPPAPTAAHVSPPPERCDRGARDPPNYAESDVPPPGAPWLTRAYAPACLPAGPYR